MRYLKLLSLILALFSTSGCNIVVVEEPIGSTPLQIERDEWEGAWTAHSSDDDRALAAYIDVVDAENGVIRLTVIEDDGVYTSRVYLRESGDQMFASIPITEKYFEFGLDEQIDPPDEELYLWGRFVKGRGAIFLWWPDVARFRELANTGQLPSRLDPAEQTANPNGLPTTQDVILGTLTPEHYDLLNSDQSRVPFEWDEPAVLIRAGN
jgi:hypothetical protein